MTNLDVTANAALDISGSTLGTDITDVTLSGGSSVDLGDLSGQTSLNSFDASANTGGVAATVSTATAGDIEEFVFSEGDDVCHPWDRHHGL